MIYIHLLIIPHPSNLIFFSSLPHPYSPSCSPSSLSTSFSSSLSAPLLATKVADDGENTELEFSNNKNINATPNMSPFASNTPDSVATSRGSPTTLPMNGHNSFSGTKKRTTFHENFRHISFLTD